ncbi:hypothetical protein GCM10010174_02680 [Kutzneria viridogrisea]
MRSVARSPPSMWMSLIWATTSIPHALPSDFGAIDATPANKGLARPISDGPDLVRCGGQLT